MAVRRVLLPLVESWVFDCSVAMDLHQNGRRTTLRSLSLFQRVKDRMQRKAVARVLILTRCVCAIALVIKFEISIIPSSLLSYFLF